MRVAHQRFHRALTTSAYVSAVLVALNLLCVSPVFSQSTYSDSWLSGTSYSGEDAEYDDATSSPVSVESCGITEGSYTHDYYVLTTIRSPNGRVVTLEGSQSVGYAQTETSLAWAEEDLGNYATESEHFANCPTGEINFFSIGTTFNGLPVGASFSCYLRQWSVSSGTAVTALYRVIENCDCTCKANTATIVFRRGPAYVPKDFLVVVEPYVITPFFGNVCSHVTTWRDLNQCNTCADIDAPG